MNNLEMVELAKKVFEKYELPEGAQVEFRAGELHVSYCFIDGDGEKEIAQIVSQLGAAENISTRHPHLVVEKSEQIARRWVTFRAQMSIVEDMPKVSQSAKDKLRERILGGSK